MHMPTPVADFGIFVICKDGRSEAAGPVCPRDREDGRARGYLPFRVPREVRSSSRRAGAASGTPRGLRPGTITVGQMSYDLHRSHGRRHITRTTLRGPRPDIPAHFRSDTRPRRFSMLPASRPCAAEMEVPLRALARDTRTIANSAEVEICGPTQRLPLR